MLLSLSLHRNFEKHNNEYQHFIGDSKGNIKKL